ncbi:hypothetical protein ABB37_06430 [Leptomonas pyrrhocoris]|uniref:Uncharacterized protein n=1 Tax=Leptomonas pyrrhocoris TaxID=157538 RepID=A0A0M9FY34_LEPPY|nr:hypothetical protein ABB37_06430 [Leptomonas pyrrhocoris]KPA78289.1 hypothetical protein ABB37_06430 [Leptomonas pyrrhocoris]|eukprot:XP_015656728.1 hypothetical protein ABB37_06430 [Leptomonas pyrrhocoris]
MSYAQPPPLRRPRPSPAVASADLNVVSSIHQANARLIAAAAAAAARSRSRDAAAPRRKQGDELSILAGSSPSPRVPSPPQADRQVAPRSSTSPPASMTTAAPSFAGSTTASPRESTSPSSTHARPPLLLPRPASQHRDVAVHIDMSPPDARPAAPRMEASSPDVVRFLSEESGPATTVMPRPAIDHHKSLEDELNRTRRQLEEVQRLYSYEKKTHLQQRTRQLRAEAEQRRTDDDVVAQTAQLLTDYEELIRFRDVASAEHLEAAMQRVSQEWRRCAAELEKTRDDCATSLLGRLQASCAAHQETLKHALQRHLVTTAQHNVETEAAQFQAIATAVQDQVGSFKAEYRAIIEQDMEERTRLMDAQAARREQQWLQFLKEEHARMIATGEVAARESSRRQLETLHVAMRDITELRENLLKEHAQRQAAVGREYVDSYEQLAEEYAAAAQETAEYVQRVQQEYADVIKRLHGEVSRVVAEKQAVEREGRQAAMHAQEAIAAQQSTIETHAEARWQTRLAEERESHRAALAHLTLQHEERLHELQVAYNSKEATLMVQYDAELSTLRDELAQQREEQHGRADAVQDRLKAAVHRLEDEKESLFKEVISLKDQLCEEKCLHEAAKLEVGREQEERFAAQLRDLDARYEAALQKYKARTTTTAIAVEEGEDGSGATSGSTCNNAAAAATTTTTCAHALHRIVELEEELQQTQRQHAAELSQAVDATTSLWSARLKDAQQRQTDERDALEAQYGRLRQTLLEEVRRREEAVESRCAAQREAHQRELQEAVVLEKEEAKRALQQLQREHDERRSQTEADLTAHAQRREDAVAAREEKLAEAEADWQRRRADERHDLLETLRQHVAAECAEQQCLLQEGEARLREEQDALAKQQLRRAHEIRVAVQQEEKTKFDAQLHDAQERWMQLMEAEARQRYATWQEARTAEMESMKALHQSEVALLRGYYTAQLQSLRSCHEHHGEVLRQEMLARETAWAAARAASLDAYETAAADRLRDVLEREKREWDAAQQQRIQVAGASLDSVAQGAVSALAATETDRRRVEQELREVYLTVLQDQERKTAQHLAELHADHEKDLAKLRQDGEERSQRQATQLREEFKQRSAQQEEHLKKVVASHEAAMAVLRAEQAEQLAAQRTAAQEALLHAHQQASDAQRAREAVTEAARREADEEHRRQLHALQQQCDAQAAQLIRKEADVHAQAQRIREEQQAALRQEYERSLASLREALEARNKSYASLQASFYEQVHTEATRISAAMEKAYGKFTEEQRTQLADRLAAQETAQMEQQRSQQEQLARLQQQHEAALTAQTTKIRDEHNNACARLKAAFDAQQAEWKKLLEAERAQRAAAESTVEALTVQIAQLQVTQEQQQAAAYRALDHEYRHLLDQAVGQLQEEREAVARRSLEEAERHFMSELLPLVRHPGDDNDEQQQQQQRTVSFTPSTSTPTPLPPYVSRDVTPPPASPTLRWRTTPPPLSPAGPVESAEAAASRLPPSPHPPTPSAPSSPQQREKDQQRLQQLWDVLEVPPDERHAFLDYVHSLEGGGAEEGTLHEPRQRAWTAELQRLEAQLPLLEALTRRDYVARQLRALRSTPPLASVAVNKSAGRKQQQLQQEERKKKSSGRKAEGEDLPPPVYERLAAELARLTEQLRHDVTAHETLYGQVFRYNGRRVMEVIGK